MPVSGGRAAAFPLPAHPPAQRQAVLGALAPALPALRFHPALACRDDAGRRRRFPALVAAVPALPAAARSMIQRKPQPGRHPEDWRREPA